MPDNTFTSALTDAKDRIVAMQKLAVSTAQAFPYASASYEYGRLYWTNFIGAFSPTLPGNDEVLYRVPFTMRLHAGIVTEGYEGTLEQEIMYTHIPNVMVYFHKRRLLIYQAGQQPPAFYNGQELTISCSGMRIFSQSEQAFVFGVEFVLTLPFQVQVKRGI